MAKPKIKDPSQQSFIEPIIRVEGEKHELEKIFEENPEKLPEIKAIGFMQIKPGNNWVSYVMTTKGKEVLKIEVSEPDLKDIAEEAAKISFVQTFVDQMPW